MDNNKQRIKMILLGCLIVATVIQTGILWLGGMSSHTFLKEATSAEPIMPINIWLVETSNNNTGVSNALAYHLDDTTGNEKREYERLTGELSKMMDKYNRDSEPIKTEGVDWTKLLSMPSIIYEYEIPIGIREITGQSNQVPITDVIDHVVIYSKSKFQKEATIFLVNTQEDFMYEFNMRGTFGDIEKIYKTVTSEELKKHIMTYQPSAAIDKVKLKGNIFLPTSTDETLTTYDVLMSYNPIDLSSNEGYALLENHINGFFKSPLVKERQIHDDGTVVYTENAKGLVVYKPIGVIEYLNLAPKQTKNITTVLGGYNAALEFMRKTDAIPKSVEPNLYLSKIEQKGQEITYAFNMTYEGYRVQLTSNIQKYLGTDALVKVTVKGNDILSATICTLEIEPKSLQTKDLNTHYLEPMDKMYSLLQRQGIDDFMIENLELVYLLKEIETDIDVTWGAVYENKWYYP